MKQSILIVFVVWFFSPIVKAQLLDSTKLNQYFQGLERTNRFMGSIAISQHGKTIYTNTTGYSDINTGKKANIETKYRIGSISKTFTATIVFKAIEAGKIALDDRLDKYFPEIANARELTIFHLLNHQSGIQNFTLNKNYEQLRIKRITREKLLQEIKNSGSNFKPGEKSAYSNSNYILLTLILEKIFNKDYSDILSEQILLPIGLKSTYYGKPTDPAQNESYSYHLTNGVWEKFTETDMSVVLGAGAIVSTPKDLNVFAKALFNHQLISPQSLAMMKNMVGSYGLGLYKVSFASKTGYGHGGNIDGFSSFLYHFDDNEVEVALTSNGSNVNNNDIAIVLLKAAYGLPFQIPNFEVLEFKSSDLDKYLGVYASKDIPLKITFTRRGNTLVAQATGQTAFKLLATGKDKFEFHKANIIFEFNPAKNTLLMEQGRRFYFTKE